MSEILDIVDEAGNVIGQDTRENIHRNGLLHREINVWFFTPKGEIVFQKRGAKKDTYPNLLDATVGGHVNVGMDFDDTSVKEIKEEIGLDVDLSKLIFLTTVHTNFKDELTGNINNAIKKHFAYQFEGDISDLKIEPGEATGFELWNIDTLLNISEKDRNRFIPAILKEPTLGILRKVKALLK